MDVINMSSGDFATGLLIFLFVCYLIAKSKYDGAPKSSSASPTTKEDKAPKSEAKEETTETSSEEPTEAKEEEPSISPDSFENRFVMDEDEGPKSENGRLKLY